MGGKRGGKWQRKGGRERAQCRGSGGAKRREGEARERVNASHVKLMRTNLQKMESCLLPTPYCYYFVSLLDLNAIIPYLPLKNLIQIARTKYVSLLIIKNCVMQNINLIRLLTA